MVNRSNPSATENDAKADLRRCLKDLRRIKDDLRVQYLSRIQPFHLKSTRKLPTASRSRAG
ncbi:hypothetical protein FIBSPDRAFT_599365 [Athelia psychrophila]|uniref:Uncharacterized protein n=1 Tax=Athelia psychrophila TaxID=1759441 RepID=A0A167T6D6_9AGAM|nr:hypothetical protein FIBSPDRAFT_599365 [Fibularhizoctonia sp. CBS 109695]